MMTSTASISPLKMSPVLPLLLVGLLGGSGLAQTKTDVLAPTLPAAPVVSPVATPSVMPLTRPVQAVSPVTDPYAPKILGVAELSRKADVIVRATVGAALTIKQGDQNWRVYPLDISETLAGDAQMLSKVKFQDKGQVLEKPALWIYADTQEAPNPQTGETMLFLYANPARGQLDSPLVGFMQGAFVVNNSRVQGLPAGTPGVQSSSTVSSAVAPAVVVAAPLTPQSNPLNTAAINSSAPPVPVTAPAALPSMATDNTSSASLPPSVAPTSAASAANIINGDIKPAPVPTAPPASVAPAPALPLLAGQLTLEEFRKLVLSSRSQGAKP